MTLYKADNDKIEWNLEGSSNYLPQAGQIVYLPEERGLYFNIPILKSLVYLASIRGMDKTEARKKVTAISINKKRSAYFST